MKTKQTLTLEVTINDEIGTFTMPVGITFGNAIDAAHQIYTEVIKMASTAAERTKPQSQEIKDE